MPTANRRSLRLRSGPAPPLGLKRVCENLCRPSTTPTSARAALVGDPGTGLGSALARDDSKRGNRERRSDEKWKAKSEKREAKSGICASLRFQNKSSLGCLPN